MGKVVERPPWAITERGRPVQYTEKEVDNVLRLLAANGGKTTRTSKQLEVEGINITHDTLDHWRDHAFPHRYMQIRTEFQREISEDLAGNLVERALEADAATQTYIQKAIDKVDQVDPDHLAKNALALANAAGSSVDRAQLLRNMPTEIVKVDLSESIATLERLKVVEAQGEVIDAEVVGEEDDA
jgi:hypothetical protein